MNCKQKINEVMLKIVDKLGESGFDDYLKNNLTEDGFINLLLLNEDNDEKYNSNEITVDKYNYFNQLYNFCVALIESNNISFDNEYEDKYNVLNIDMPVEDEKADDIYYFRVNDVNALTRKIFDNGQCQIEFDACCKILEHIVNKDDLSCHAMIFPMAKENIALASIKLKILYQGARNGRCIDERIRFSQNVNTWSYLSTPTINYSEDFTQYGELFTILNEYNSTEYLLDKYLKLYHIFENLYIRVRIVEMINSARFCMRDIKNMIGETKSEEIKQLKGLFINIAKQIPTSFNSGALSGLCVKKHWDSVFNAQEQQDVLRILKTKLNIESFNAGDSNLFASLVYKIRNTIVHSKDTELHITDTYLKSSNDGRLMKRLIEDFLILTLENICFDLLSNTADDNIIRYSRNSVETKLSEVLRNQI